MAEQRSTFRDRCARCLRGPREILRSIVLLTCTVIVVCQIAECVRKIVYLPTTTYTHFEFNDTIMYPAVTVCREPAYKPEVLQEHGLYGHPRFTSEWEYFPFGSKDLKDFWEEATYNDKDNFLFYGLDTRTENVEMTNSLHFVHGQCQTLKPRSPLTTALKATGYSFQLNHSMADASSTSSTVPPGYHIYIHQHDEPFSEQFSNIQMEHLYVNVGEEVDVKLHVQQLTVLPGGAHACRPEPHYSASLCSQTARCKKILDNVGCSGPWMATDVPFCNNYSQMKNLIVQYINLTGQLSAAPGCPRRCLSLLHAGDVVSRNALTAWSPQAGQWHYKTGLEKYQTQMYIYFNTKTVSFYDETHSYDWSLFLADFGGSLGFLLGLSVLGVITLLEEVYGSFIQPLVPRVRGAGGPGVKGSPGSEGSSVNGDGGSSTKEFEYQVFGEKQFYI